MIKKVFSHSIIISFGAIILLGSLHVFGVLQPLEGILFRILGPIQRPFYKMGNGIANSFHFISSVRDLAKENKDMTDEINDLTSRIALLEEVKRENNVLRDQLKLTSRDEFVLDSALVIGRDPSNLSREIIIDKGSSSGIQKDMAVIISEGILVGRISEVFKDSSKVLLITDSRSLVNATVQETRATGIVRGQHGLGLVMDTIPQNEVVQKDDVIITSGLGGVFPKGLVIGKIKELKNTDNELFQEATVQPLFHLKDVELVFIILN